MTLEKHAGSSLRLDSMPPEAYASVLCLVIHSLSPQVGNRVIPRLPPFATPHHEEFSQPNPLTPPEGLEYGLRTERRLNMRNVNTMWMIRETVEGSWALHIFMFTLKIVGRSASKPRSQTKEGDWSPVC